MLTGQILLELVVILLVVQLFGHLCRFIGQQWVIGEVLAGLALGPSLFGVLLPGLSVRVFPPSVLPTLQTLGDIGLVLYMFSLGARMDTHMMVRQSRKAIVASLSSILLPLLLGGLLAFFLYADFAGGKASQFSFILLIGTAISITAFPVLARLLTERQMLGTRIGTLALTCASINDVIAWFLLALVVAVAHAKGPLGTIFILGLTILYIGFMFVVIRPLLVWAARHIHSTQTLVVLALLLVLLSAYLTNAIGIHPIFGAFLMGVILPRRAVFVEYIRSIDRVNSMLFLPLFFVYNGLRTQIGLINAPTLWLICLLVLAVACLSKLAGVTLPIHWMGESWRDALSLGVLMNTRGLVELIVLNIGLDLGIISPTLFAMLVIMAVITTMMASPFLPLLGYRGHSRQHSGERDSSESNEEKVVPQVDS